MNLKTNKTMANRFPSEFNKVPLLQVRKRNAIASQAFLNVFWLFWNCRLISRILVMLIAVLVMMDTNNRCAVLIVGNFNQIRDGNRNTQIGI